MSILAVFGTRPEYIKLKPLFKTLNLKKCFVKQHTNIIDFGEYDYSIDILQNNTNRLNSIFSQSLSELEPIIHNHDAVIVIGDTATVAAVSIATFNQKKKLVHLEAGLRSFDLQNPYPEEAYRQMVSRITSIHLCPTQLSKQNLINEKVNGEIHVVGNTALDNLLFLKESAKYSDEVLITLHRNENLPIIKEWFTEIEKIANNFPSLKFTIPLHPNSIIKEAAKVFKKVNVIEPLEHLDLLEILKNTKCVISDSGGIQEEGSFLNKKVIVCRKTTERPEGIDSGHLTLCESSNKLNQIFTSIIENYKIDSECPYGDGKASEKISKILKEYE